MSELAKTFYLKLDNKIHELQTNMRRMRAEEEGAVAAEYALVIAVVVVGVIGAATVMFDPLKEFFGRVVDTIGGLF